MGESGHRVKLLSYNIQAGVDTRHYRQYLTQSGKQLLPHRKRLLNLNRIAAMVGRYDIVGLQEVDSGSLRSGFVDQTEYLARQAGFPHWHKQINRRLCKLAQHSNGLLSRIRPAEVREYRLPGRGAICIAVSVRGGRASWWRSCTSPSAAGGGCASSTSSVSRSAGRPTW
ncbi:MAG: hypothetical protein AB2814_02600 [Candidatus Sedimenticola endophacoides]